MDELGGWRENWMAIYVGRKPLEDDDSLIQRRLQQVVVNIVRCGKDVGKSDAQALKAARNALEGWTLRDNMLRRATTNGETAKLTLTPDEILAFWNARAGKNPAPSGERFLQAAIIGLT